MKKTILAAFMLVGITACGDGSSGPESVVPRQVQAHAISIGESVPTEKDVSTVSDPVTFNVTDETGADKGTLVLNPDGTYTGDALFADGVTTYTVKKAEVVK